MTINIQQVLGRSLQELFTLDLATHMSAEHKLTWRVCDECGETFREKGTIKEHMSTEGYDAIDDIEFDPIIWNVLFLKMM